MSMPWSEVAGEQAIACLRLHVVQGVGPLRFRSLLEHFGSVAQVLQADASELRRVRNIGPAVSEAIVQRPDDGFVQAELQRARRLGVRIICQQDDEYPPLLREVPDAPICLYVCGALSPQDSSSLAIVGSRRCSHYGREQAHQFGMAAARAGLTVVSGLARGVDAEAHAGALACRGRTIAVLGSGLGHMDTHHNAKLAERIVESGGAVISELPLERPPDPANFPPRNRIIAGLSLGTLVIEAALRSGALITARLALEYNREVFAVPGRIDNPFAAGTLKLIQDSQAKLTASLEDILAELRHAGREITHSRNTHVAETLVRVAPDLTAEEKRIMEVLDAEGVDLERVSRGTRLPPEVISSSLTMLQLKGVVTQLPGNRFARVGL